MTDRLDVNCDVHELMVPKFGPKKVVCRESRFSVWCLEQGAQQQKPQHSLESLVQFPCPAS